MTNQTELTAERVERAIAIQQELMRDMRSDDVDEENRETAEEVAVIVETVVLPVLRAEQERQWISVKDRLPDMCGCKCLVVGTNRFGQVDVFTAFTGYMERGKLEFHSCEPTHEIPAWTVTHWMPLPKPPAHCGRLLTEGSAE